MPTVAQAVGRTLAALGVRHAFGVVGGGNILAAAALTAEGVHYTAARHEGGAMAMADACFRATGEVAVCTTTHGPGIANTLTPLADAAKSRSGVLLLCGDAPLSGPRRHDIDQSALLAAIGVRTLRPTDPATARAAAAEALRLTREHHQPVALLLPADLTDRPVPAAETDPVAAVPVQRPASAPDLSAALSLLSSARRPLLLAGLGAWHADAGKILRQLGDRLGALFATTVMAGGLFHDSPWSLGVCGGFAAPAAAALMRQADVVLAFGSSLDTFTLHGGRALDPAATVIQVDLPDATPSSRTDLLLTGDAHTTAVRLLDAVETLPPPASTWRDASAPLVAQAQAGWAD
ncbi:hypothetical protein C6N75_20120, partial [Streptomyces solincola]